MSKKKSKTKVNCRDGLGPRMEIEARRIKDKLLDESKRQEVVEDISNVFEEFQNLTFEQYFKVRNPALYSACKRAGVSIETKKGESLLIIK